MNETPFRRKLFGLASILLLLASGSVLAGQGASGSITNRADRLEWFRDLGFGLFIHWSVDSQLGTVISHSMVGASDDYLKRFIQDLPTTFNPHKFRAQDLAVLSKLAGVRYVVFTAKHHSGFCMYDTKTTEFNIMNTPFKRDVTGEILKAFSEHGMAPGLYFSPDDFLWLHKNGKDIQRRFPQVHPINNPGLMELDLAQVRELMTKYGPVNVVFLDGPAEKLRDLCWQLQPDTVVTRGAIQTPEKTTPGQIIEGPWEACHTMGHGWQYQPTHEEYKSGVQLIHLLIETRAKGGNLLLNVGPKPDGELPIEQEERLREIAQWMHVNSEGIYGVRPWVVTNERDIWFTKRKDADTVYVFVKPVQRWRLGDVREVMLSSVRATGSTKVSVLGQNDRVLEYSTNVPATTWKQEADGLVVRFTQAQRLHDNRTWPNPVVLKITHAEAVKSFVRVETGTGRWDAAAGSARLEGNVLDLGGASEVEAGFEYRDITGQDTDERTTAWVAAPAGRRAGPGVFSAGVRLTPGRAYEFRAVIRAGARTGFGRETKIEAR